MLLCFIDLYMSDKYRLTLDTTDHKWVSLTAVLQHLSSFGFTTITDGNPLIPCVSLERQLLTLPAAIQMYLGECASVGNPVLIKPPQRIPAWLELTLRSLLARRSLSGENTSKESRRTAEWESVDWNLLILLVRWSVCQWGLISITILPNMPKPSKVHPCAIYYCHLSASWERGLKSIMSFVLYVECCIKCLRQVCRIDRRRRRRSGGWHFPPHSCSLISAVVRVRSQAWETHTQKERDDIWKFRQTSDNEWGQNKALITECCSICRKMSGSSRAVFVNVKRNKTGTLERARQNPAHVMIFIGVSLDTRVA